MVDTNEPSKPTATAPRDSAYWARPVAQLTVDELPTEAINLNVDGRRLSGPIQGFGRMWRKQHRVVLTNATVTPAEVVGIWKENFGSFWPAGNRFYGPLTALAPGDVAVLNLAMPGGQKLSTGVMVLYADDESFALMTPQGHIFSGWITFSAFVENGHTVAQAEILMRASDPIYEIGMELIGHRQENAFWERTLATLAARFGVTCVAETTVECVDPRYQWAHARNVWQNAAIRTGVYVGTRPVRTIAGHLRRRFASGTRG